MKIFSIRNMLGAAAAYGAYRYAQSHGGWRQAFDEIVGKVREAAQQREMGSQEPSIESSMESELGGESGELGKVSEASVSEVTESYTR